jgi:hypothetical protein
LLLRGENDQRITRQRRLREHTCSRSGFRARLPRMDAQQPNTIGPLDVVITGYAFENATAAFRVLEADKQARGWISTEMLCTLDNFIKVILFSDHVFVYPYCATLQIEADGSLVIDHVQYKSNVTDRAKEVLNSSGIFSTLPLNPERGGWTQSNQRAEEVLKSISLEKNPWCVLTCSWDADSTSVLQEIASVDAAHIEGAIQQSGLKAFKPVFPGEHIYLGLRCSRLTSPPATHNIADLAVRRLRSVVREKLIALNEQQVSLGGEPLPVLPPMFVSRLLGASQDRNCLSESLVQLRDSSAFVQFRKSARKCHQLLESSDTADRAKAAEIIKQFEQFDFPKASGSIDSGKAIFKWIKAVAGAAHGDISGAAEELIDLAGRLFKEFSKRPLLALEEFSDKKASSKKLDAYLTENFADRFNPHELDTIATLLWLPDTVKSWRGQTAKLDAGVGRLEVGIPPDARTVDIHTRTRL